MTARTATTNVAVIRNGLVRQELLLPQGHRYIDAASWLEEEDRGSEVIWGEDEKVLWPSGEALLIVGSDGVGKTTLAQQLILARCGVFPSFLGMHVAPTQSRVLYVAADRPRQARRSLKRMVTRQISELVGERLFVWTGPPDRDIAMHTDTLWEMTTMVDADTVVLDSYKDLAVGLSNDDTGAAVNLAIQKCLARNVEVLGLHHPRKANSDNKNPINLEDVYGSRWLTAGVGSVLMISGRAGDSSVTAYHRKQPMDEVGPLKVRHDHRTGRSVIVDSVDSLKLLQGRPQGLTARDLAMADGNAAPTNGQVEKARRELDSFVKRGWARCVPGSKGGPGGGAPSRWYAIFSADNDGDHADS
jgi:replicative DNA helicase